MHGLRSCPPSGSAHPRYAPMWATLPTWSTAAPMITGTALFHPCGTDPLACARRPGADSGCCPCVPGVWRLRSRRPPVEAGRGWDGWRRPGGPSGGQTGACPTDAGAPAHRLVPVSDLSGPTIISERASVNTAVPGHGMVYNGPLRLPANAGVGRGSGVARHRGSGRQGVSGSLDGWTTCPCYSPRRTTRSRTSRAMATITPAINVYTRVQVRWTQIRASVPNQIIGMSAASGPNARSACHAAVGASRTNSTVRRLVKGRLW